MPASTTFATALPTTPELEQLAKSAKYNLAAFAKLCGYRMNTWQFRREFRKRCKLSPRAWLRLARIKDAEARLLCGERPKDMVFYLGFGDLHHLSHFFKRANGMSPVRFARSRLPPATRA